MDTKVYIREVSVLDDKLFLILKNQNPQVEWKDQTFTHLWFLINKLPSLSNPQHIKCFAEISNFFWKGLQCQCIESIAEYQTQYREQIKLEKKHPADVFPYRLTDYKTFDVSAIHAPKLERGQLIYFVSNMQTGLPYRVVCPFPYPSAESTLVHYQILPILDDE